MAKQRVQRKYAHWTVRTSALLLVIIFSVGRIVTSYILYYML